MNRPTRREFLKAGTMVGLGALGGKLIAADSLEASPRAPSRLGPQGGPVVISSRNGLPATERAMELMGSGVDTLDAVVEGVGIVEADPEDTSVRGAGAVGALEGFKHPAQVARTIMQYTDHVFLVGAGAAQFAREMGFEEEELLTDRARRVWLRWRSRLSPDDDYLTPEQSEEGITEFGLIDAWEGKRHYGTINCCAVNAAGELSGVTTTSGLAFKVPGRVGDSPIIGAGLYVDNDVGAAGSTGRGEAVIKSCGSMMIVEFMRRGQAPKDACLAALARIAHLTTEKRLLDEEGKPNFNVNFYAVNKRGEYGAAAIWSGSRFSVCDSAGNRHEDSAYLFEREE
jgi:N4-(beta-N-acetylglucosaminyl)-L-asparaginase